MSYITLMRVYEYNGKSFKVEPASRSIKVSTDDFSATLSELQALQALQTSSVFIGRIVGKTAIERLTLHSE